MLRHVLDASIAVDWLLPTVLLHETQCTTSYVEASFECCDSARGGRAVNIST